MKPYDLLNSYAEALRPIIYINNFDFVTVEKLIVKAKNNHTIHEYNHANGWMKWTDYPIKEFKEVDNLKGFLKTFDKTFDKNREQNCFLVLKDIHDELNQKDIIAHLKSIAHRTIYDDYYYVTVFIVATKLKIPRELEKLVTLFDLPLPNINEIEETIDQYCTDLKIEIVEDVKHELVASFKGLSLFEIRQILNLAYQQSGTIDQNDNALILREKEQIIKRSGMLEIINLNDTIEDVGGLENLKNYLKKKSHVFKSLGRARRFGVDPPKGILIAGMPGCGKSLTSKATAQLFQVPLLRLDVGKLMGKYVGESEQNMRYAIKTAEAVSPCVLWIDELEKAFAGIGGNSGGSDVTTRLFGHLLTWLQEKDSAVYVVATSNDISKLPPEFMRKGRFDELFYVDFPNEEERKKIFEIHLSKRNKLSKAIDTIRLIKESKGFCGADIEAVVREAVEDAFIEGESVLNTERLFKILRETRPISETLKGKIEKMKNALKEYDMKPASLESFMPE